MINLFLFCIENNFIYILIYVKLWYNQHTLHVKNVLTLGKSLIYIRNNKGPRMEPCCTPVVIHSQIVHYCIQHIDICWINN